MSFNSAATPRHGARPIFTGPSSKSIPTATHSISAPGPQRGCMVRGMGWITREGCALIALIGSPHHAAPLTCEDHNQCVGGA